jgi:two-component system OmpR family sensor kinase
MWCDRCMRNSALVRALFRLPIRMRLTLVFVGVMALVLGAAGFFLHREFERDLDRSIDDAQRAQALDIAALVEGARGPSSVADSGERYAQVYDSDGRLLGSTPQARGERLLSRAEVRQAVRQTMSVERRAIGESDVRVRAVPGRLRSGERAVIAVGDSLGRRDDNLAALDRLLLIALPLALLIAGFAGYEVAGAALRPVDEMRRRAAEISDTNPSERLPLPEARDEVGALGKTLNAMLGRLEQAVARERRLLNDASHELRTPLTTLRAELELALRGDRDPSELRSAIESGLEEARRMSRLANDLLVLARADEGKLPLEAGPEGAIDLLAAAAERARAAVNEVGRSVVLNDETRGAVVLVDADRVAQALDNLIANSLRYGAGVIELKAKQDDGLIELHVLDSGAGFDEDFRARAFERFSRDAPGSERPSGAGLGLAIVAAIATAHGGAAGTRNRADGGADVWLSLPQA